MFDENSANLSMPLLLPAQAQKHVTHNEALMVLDALVQLSALDRTRAVPPAAPAEGDRHIVPAGAGAAWGGADHAIACFTGTGWRFFAPRPGWRIFVTEGAQDLVWHGGAWQAVAGLGGGGAALSAPQLGLNTTADAVNRLAVSAPATLLSHEGAGHQLKINKAGPAETASLLFQSGWSGRAEMGLAGTDGFSVKVSADGAAWTPALEIAAASGITSLAAPLRLAPGTASAPACAFAADTDTGIFLDGTDAIGFATGGSRRVRLTTAEMRVDLPLTGTAVTQSATDATAGRVLKVGDFGLGATGAPPLLANLDATATPAGVYLFNLSGGSAGTAPAGVTSGVVQVARQAGTTLFQEALAGERRFIRSCAAGVWGAWRPLVPEHGSNANGDYMRLADGTQICWAVKTATRRSVQYIRHDWTYPAAFVGAPAVAILPLFLTATGYGPDVTTRDRWGAAGLNTHSATTALCDVFRSFGAPDIPEGAAMDLCLRAVGRWF